MKLWNTHVSRRRWSLQDEIDALRTVQPDLIPEDINAASLVDVEAEVSAVQPPPTDAEILADFCGDW